MPQPIPADPAYGVIIRHSGTAPMAKDEIALFIILFRLFRRLRNIFPELGKIVPVRLLPPFLDKISADQHKRYNPHENKRRTKYPDGPPNKSAQTESERDHKDCSEDAKAGCDGVSFSGQGRIPE
jgi:hypothetical protein